MKRRPLEGVRVLDMTMMWAGPYATKMLGEMGAEVVKIESPKAWDNIRTLMPQPEHITDPWNSAHYFAEYNHEKKSVTLDLATAVGRDVFLRLVANSDVVIENYRADVMDNLGLGTDVLLAAKPDLIAVSMAGFGKAGADRHNVGYGPIIEMMSGLMSLSGYDPETPQKTGVSYGDPVAGLAAVSAIALGLIKRRTDGRGHRRRPLPARGVGQDGRRRLRRASPAAARCRRRPGTATPAGRPRAATRRAARTSGSSSAAPTTPSGPRARRRSTAPTSPT